MKRKMMIVLAGIVSSVFASDIHVSPTGDGSDGLSWDTAFTNIQSAVDAAGANDTIQIAAGQYALRAPIDFAAKLSVAMQGAGAGDTVILPAASATTRLLNIAATTNCSFSGITFTGGRAVVAADQIAYGGCAFISDSIGLRFSDCEIIGNQAEVLSGSGTTPAQGGGFWVSNSVVAVTGTLFENNEAMARNGGLAQGGALGADRSTLSITNCIVRRNRASRSNASGTTEATFGGGFYLTRTAADLYNCLLVFNDTANRLQPKVGTGAAIYIYSNPSSLTMRNCTVAFNNGSHAFYLRQGTGTFHDSIFVSPEGNFLKWQGNFNLYNSVCSETANATASACTVGDPLFAHDFYLDAASPAIDKGSANAADTCLATWTTQTDGALDTGKVDAGYHHGAASTGWGGELYVSPSGNDGNPGTQAQPLRSVTKAASLAQDGSTIHVAAGTYDRASAGESFPLMLTNRYDFAIVGADAGTTVLDNKGEQGKSLMIIDSCNDLSFSGLTFTGGCYSNATTRQAGGVEIRRSTSVTMDACAVSGNTVLFLNGNANIGPGGMRIERSSGVLVTSCTVSGNAISNTLSASYTDNAEGGGLWLCGGFVDVVNTRIQNNAVQARGTAYGGGIYADGGAPYTAGFYLRNCLIADNFVGGLYGTLHESGGGVHGQSGDITFDQCTIATNTHSGISTWNGAHVLNNCIVHGNGDDLYGRSVYTVKLVNVLLASGEVDFLATSTGVSHGDPRFKDAAQENFHLRSDSPAKDAGAVLGWMDAAAVDLDGLSRIYNGLPDLGCYELQKELCTLIVVH